MFMQVNKQQVLALEKATHGQAGKKAWFCHREGRTNLKSVVKTNQSMPSVSLIKRICYPKAFKFTTESTRYELY